jgi:5-methylcytosine-specific restriction endonuclease McrA
LATFHVGVKTHQSVLPQRAALEFESADNPGSGDETGPEDRDAVPGMEPLRGETIVAAPGRNGATSEPAGVGETARERHSWVFVLDKHGQPLQPTTPARARRLLRQRRAVVARHTPFVIRLKDRVVDESEVDGVEIGIDPGSRHSGIAVFTALQGERRSRFSIQVDHRGEAIRRRIAQRALFRRNRRSRNLPYRAPRYSNRARPDGWLAPSLRHRVETTLNWVDRLSRWAPVRAAHVESVAFDTHAISAGRPLNGVEYQHGTLHGMEVREYLLAKWSYSCAYCGMGGAPLNIDHLHPRARGGSDRIANLVIACVTCNQGKGDQRIEDFLVDRPELLERIKTQVKTPLRDAAVAQATRTALLKGIGSRLPTQSASGGRTKWNRTRFGLPKTHTLDALAVGRCAAISETSKQVLVATCTGRGTYTRTRPDRYGFPRLRLPRQKRIHGFATGDFAKAVIPAGKKRGTYTGRVSVRISGNFNIATGQRIVQGLRHKHFRLLQRADGYSYTRKEEGMSSPVKWWVRMSISS